MNHNQYIEQLQNPALESRGLTRWWWYGCAVKRDEIVDQLDEMKAQNIGGVEIQILYPVVADNSVSGRKNIEYFSPEFFEILEFTKQETEKRNMVFDLTLGSSWPYGGPFVTDQLSAPVVHPYTIDVTGPCSFSYDFTTRTDGEIIGCIMGQMVHSKMIPETIVDIKERIDTKYLFNWPWGAEINDLEIPEGDYKIVAFVASKYRQHVLAPMKGAEGWVIDHNRKDAAQLFFDQAGTPIVERLGKGAVKTFFCDSIEVTGHNWTHIMYEEFEKRRGYSLKPYIYALYGEIEGLTEQIRYDFHKTYGELTVENFFEEMTNWCHEMGSMSRIQAHGTWGDILKAYGAADVPEGEAFSSFDKYSVNTIHRRLASSAGNVYHKPIISNESFTWLRFPRYIVTLEQIKVAADAIFLDGMNQIVNHGFTYNSKEELSPFYASSHICNTNTWWDYYKNIGDYIHRVSHFMQKGKTKAEVCIYLPQNDIWAENPMCDLHMCMKLEERLGAETVTNIAKAGYWFDYVNDDVVQRFDEFQYEVLIIMETKRLPVETAEAIYHFAQNGNIVIIADKVPDCSCGFVDAELKTHKIDTIMKKLQELETVYIVEDKNEALINSLQMHVIPDMSISEGKEWIGYIHKQDKESDIYFVSNTDKKEYRTTLTIKGNENACIILDPMNGTVKEIIGNNVKDGNKQITLLLEPLQSVIMILDSNLIDQTPVSQDGISRMIDISEDWGFINPLNRVEQNYHTLRSWEQDDSLKYYSGTASYSKEVYIEQVEKGMHYTLSFEHVGECARVYVNDKRVGDIIKYPYTIDITEYVHQGENILRVDVTNLLINQMINPDYQVPLYEEKILDGWPYFSKPINNIRQKRLSNWREIDMVKEPMQSGLWGNVSIIVE